MTKARDLANAGTALTTVSATELGYLDGVTSAVQTQIDSKIGQSTAINPTIVDAKGDIVAATAADTVARLAVGSNNTVLTADSSTATGLKWAAPAGGGKVLQVVNVTPTTTFSSTSATLVDATNYTVSITPTSATSKIYVVFNLFSQVYGNSANNQYGAFKILRDSTAVYGEGTYCGMALPSTQNMEFATRFSANFIDSPATTSSITYKIQVKNISGGTVIVGTPSSLTLFEIGA